MTRIINFITETYPKKGIPDLHLTYSKKRGKSGVDVEKIKNDFFQDISLNSYVVDIY